MRTVVVASRDVTLSGVTAIAYFITIHTYGTRLRGDARGWIDKYQNCPGSPLGEFDRALAATHAARMTCPPVTLNRAARLLVNQAFVDVCDHLSLRLHAKNVRTEHAHIVLAAHSGGHGASQAPIDPGILAGKLKSRSTRLLANAGILKRGTLVWADGRSARHLFTFEDIEIAARYVRDDQGPDLDS